MVIGLNGPDGEGYPWHRHAAQLLAGTLMSQSANLKLQCNSEEYLLRYATAQAYLSAFVPSPMSALPAVNTECGGEVEHHQHEP